MTVYGSGLLKSMRIAFRNMVRKPITVQYPHQKLVLPERARWALAHKFYDDGDPKCTACLACERACPDFVIEIVATTNEDRSKHIDHYRYEIGACMMCGLCVESCPFDAIEMSHNYELARIGADLLTIDLLTDVPAAQPKKRAEVAAAATGPKTPAENPGGDAASAAGAGAQEADDARAEAQPDAMVEDRPRLSGSRSGWTLGPLDGPSAGAGFGEAASEQPSPEGAVD